MNKKSYISPEEIGTSSYNNSQQQQQKECQPCMKYLLSTLHSPNSKPMALFRAMGVDVTSYKLNSDGIKVQIPQQTTLTTNIMPTPASVETPSGFGGERTNRKSGNERSNKDWVHSSSSLEDTVVSTRNLAARNIVGPPPQDEKTSKTIMTKLKNRLTKRFLQPNNNTATTSTNSITTSSNSPTCQSTIPPSPPTIIRTPTAVATSAISKPPMELQITCQKCGNDGPEGGARAFVKGPDPLSIVLCSNRLSSQQEINEVLVHELIHVYDVHHRKWDLTNCYTLAKSEVRAAREAECAGATMSFTKRYCAKEKARVATKNMFPDVGLQCVAAVFEEAMVDKAPFVGDGKGFGGESDKEEAHHVYDGGRRSFKSTYPSDSSRRGD